MGPEVGLLPNQGAQTVEIEDIFGEVFTLVGLQGHRQVVETGIVEQVGKSLQADAALANVGVAVNPAAAILLRIVEMDETDLLQVNMAL